MQRSSAGGMERLSSTFLRFTPTPIQPGSRPQTAAAARAANFCRRAKVTVSLAVENNQQIHAKIIIVPFLYKTNYILMFVCF